MVASAFRSKWRLEGRWQCETFTNARLAAEFRTAVFLHAHLHAGGSSPKRCLATGDPSAETTLWQPDARGIVIVGSPCGLSGAGGVDVRVLVHFRDL